MENDLASTPSGVRPDWGITAPKTANQGLVLGAVTGGGVPWDPEYGGEGGIRTHDPLRDTAFRERRLKPLGHLSLILFCIYQRASFAAS